MKNKILFITCVSIAGFFLGVIFDHVWFQAKSNVQSATPLRLSGYTYISPLLAYDIDRNSEDPKFNKLKSTLTDTITNEINANRIDDVSIYFRALSSGEDMNINPNLTFEPGSLSKVPLLIALLRKAEQDPEFLNSKITLTSEDTNAHIEVQPSQVLTPTASYTVAQAIDALITKSDNNPYQPLFNTINFADFQKSFNDLQLPFQNASQGFDFFTTKDFSYFLRVLYNASYLSKDNSERAMQMLTKTDFNDGIVAGVPKTVMVAHKFGISTHFSKDWTVVESRQLHDCGLVYATGHPYILCIMTKGKSTLSDSEGVINKISTSVYDAVENNFQ